MGKKSEKTQMDSAAKPVPTRYSDLESELPPELALLPFLPNMDPAFLKIAVRKHLAGEGCSDSPEPASVSR